MKQTKKEKDNYLKFSFLFPIVVSAIDAVIVLAGMYALTNRGTITNVAMARLLAQAAVILISLSPTGMLITAFIGFRHAKKHPDSSAFYMKAPMIISILVWGIQVLYMATLTGA